MYLGNLDSKRDWGHAKDYVKAMWLMLQSEIPNDYVIATGKTTSIREFIIKAFKVIEIEIEFSGTGLNEIGTVTKVPENSMIKLGQVVVKVDERYYRPTEVDLLIGDPSKAKKDLKWKPEYDLDMLVEEMVHSDINLFNNK